MENIIDKCDRVLNELSKFSTEIIDLGSAISDNRLTNFESKIGYTLPEDFKYILSIHNGFSLEGKQVYGYDKAMLASSIDLVYEFEQNSSKNNLPNYFLPFSPDGRGNHYCLNLQKLENGICPVVFWQSDFHYNDISEVEECNESFVSWISEVIIEWTLEDYNYDGSEKD